MRHSRPFDNFVHSGGWRRACGERGSQLGWCPTVPERNDSRVGYTRVPPIKRRENVFSWLSCIGGARVTKDPSPGRRERACGRYMKCAGAIPGIFTIRHARHIARTRGHGKVGLVVIAQPISEVDSLCTTCTFIAVLRERPADMCVHAEHLHPLCRRYLWSQRSREGRSSHVQFVKVALAAYPFLILK